MKAGREGGKSSEGLICWEGGGRKRKGILGESATQDGRGDGKV